MKQTLLFISVLLIVLPMVASAQEETVLETQHSGCLGNTRGYMDEWVPATRHIIRSVVSNQCHPRRASTLSARATARQGR